MKKTGWTVMGDGSNLRLAEFRLSECRHADELHGYEEAKQEALTKLREHIEPYLEQIARLESDEFAIAGKLPPCKAWMRYGWRAADQRVVVAAKTKQRAKELAYETRFGIDQRWHEAGGDWWYPLALEEGVWIEELDDKNQGTGTFYRPLDNREASEIAEQHLARIRSMPIDKLLRMIGMEAKSTGESSRGTPYVVSTSITLPEGSSGGVYAEVTVDDKLGWDCPHWSSCHRELPPESIDWRREGF